MYTLKPLPPPPPPGPPQSGWALGIPLAVNAALLLFLNILSHTTMVGGAAVGLVFYQFFFNFLFMLGAFLSSKQRWGIGFLLSGILVLLVGVGMCGQQL